MGVKIVLGFKNGVCVQKELSEDYSKALYGKKIGDVVRGEEIGLEGYEFDVTGGSDYCGFAMRKDVGGQLRRKILTVGGVGVKAPGNGVRIRKTVAGNTIYAKTHQVNLKVVKVGKENLIPEPKAEEKADVKPAEAAA